MDSQLPPSPADSVLAELSRRLRESFGTRLKHVILYGSHARGQATPASDIDILVVVDPVEDKTADWDRCIDIVADLGSRTGELVSVLTCSLEEYRHRAHPLLVNVRSEGVEVL